MPKKMKLSDILEAAAQQFEDGTNVSPWSCCVVDDLVDWYIRDWNKSCKMMDTFTLGVENMGIDTQSFSQFKDVPLEQRPQARALWLSWCAMMAREQGL